MPADPTVFNIRQARRPPNTPVAFHFTGALPTAKWQRQLLLERVPRALDKRTPHDITYGVKLMVAVQRYIARNNTGVGTDAMAVMIPRTSFGEQMLRVLNGGMIMNSGPGGVIGGSSGPEFIYFDTQGFNHRQFGPHNAAWGMAQADMVGAHEPDNPDHQTVSIKILKFPKHVEPVAPCEWNPTRTS